MFVPIPEASAFIKAVGCGRRRNAKDQPRRFPTFQRSPSKAVRTMIYRQGRLGRPKERRPRLSIATMTRFKRFWRPDVVARLSGLGMDIKTDSPSEFAAYIR
jgi:hypothetical protein